MRYSGLAIVLMTLALCGCKENRKPEGAAKRQKTVIPLQELAEKSLRDKGDWTRDLEIYIDDVLTCANAAPAQTKYVFHADAFETPTLTLILLKSENDKVYACSFEQDDPAPHYQVIKLTPPAKDPRFYPGELPKPDSCLNNVRILDKTGRTAGWLSRITC